jgi:hypothetical protein
MRMLALLPPLACAAMMFVMAKMMMGSGRRDRQTSIGADADRDAIRAELERLRAERERLNAAGGDE